MDLGRIANHFNAAGFEYLDPNTRQWVDGFNGRLAATDRFLSNFNRPTRKRMLYVDFSEDLSTIDVIKHKLTGEIYLLGIGRRDDLKTNPTTQLHICHMATPGLSAGLATVDRAAVQGAGDDLGWVQITPVGTTYLDLELRSTGREPGSKEVELGNYFGFAEAHGDFKKGDRMTLNGVPYVVDELAYDSGFRMLRLTERDLHYVNTVFTIETAARTYDRDTGKFVTAPATRNVSALWIGYHDSNDGYSKDAVDYAELRIETDHIGFDPAPGMKVELNGKDYTVTYVELSEYRRQWIVRVK